MSTVRDHLYGCGPHSPGVTDQPHASLHRVELVPDRRAFIIFRCWLETFLPL